MINHTEFKTKWICTLKSVIHILTERKKTKRKVELTSSHSDRDSEDGPLAPYILKAQQYQNFTKTTETGPHLCDISQEKGNN